MNSGARSSLFAVLLGVLFVVAGIIIGSPHETFNGVVLGINVNGTGPLVGRPVHLPKHLNITHGTGMGLVDPADGNLWVGAGIVLLVLGGTTFLRRRRRSSSTVSSDGRP